jgi:peptide/nickel transport system substrate-binding protein
MKKTGKTAALALTAMMAVTAMPFGVSADETDKTIVRINMESEPDNLDPWLSAASDTEAVFHNVFEGLVLFDETGALIPGLAKSWDISDDGLTYTFHLRDDVTFHNGKAFSAEDVVYTYEALSGLSGEEPLSSKFTNVTAINAIDDYTVELTLGEADAAFLQYTRVAVLPKGYEDQSSAPVGTGPFVFEKYVPGQMVVLEKNENYYDESRMAKIDEAQIYIMGDDSAVLTALQSGQLDAGIVYADSADYLSGDFTINSSPQNMVQLFALNNSVEPFDDVRVRQAFEYAINKDQIIDGVFAGYATELYSNFSPVMSYFYNDELSDVYTYDVEKAKELMAEAGYEDGFDITITVPSNYQKHVDTAQVIAQQLKEINVNATIEPVEWGQWLEQVYTNAEYETTIVGLTGKLDPNDILGRYVSDYGKNFMKYSNPDYDKLIEEAKTASDEERVELFKECQKVLTEDAAAVWICDPNAIAVTRSDLKGYTFYPVSFIDLSKLYYEE